MANPKQRSGDNRSRHQPHPRLQQRLNESAPADLFPRRPDELRDKNEEKRCTQA